jgi:hypothetical protein
LFLGSVLIGEAPGSGTEGYLAKWVKFGRGIGNSGSHRVAMALQGFLRGLSLLTGLSKLQPSSSRVDGIGNHHQELSFVASPQEQLIITLDKPVRVEVGIASASKTLFNLHESLYDGTRHNVSGLLFRSHSGRYSSD